MSNEIIEKPKLLFEMKGGLLPLMTVCVHGTDLTLFEDQLKDKIQQAPNFFQHSPVVIDVKTLTEQNLSIDIGQLKALLMQNKLIPVGLRHAHMTLQEEAIKHGMAILKESPISNKKTTAANTETAKTQQNNEDTPPEAAKIEIQSQQSKVITEPVRSGQQIYARGGDLIILSSVSNGAEVLADGHIHIYGTLRGRALAGLNGQAEARIFCHCLEAELISISGQYKVSDDIEPSFWKQAVEVLIKEEHLHIRLL